ncbi:hypothetical protein AGMMS50293_24550 [Spirochaetia bacterium]|nr:hypothetical protein AGMMS50293_24550 [Spirochaetia bacterium]
MMKRIVLIVLMACGIAALVSARGKDGDRWGRGNFPGGQSIPAEQVTVTGALTIVQGSLAVKSGDITYLVPELRRYVGFIDSLKDGAQVKLEGSAVSGNDANAKFLWVQKLSIGGKDYDLARPRPQPTVPAQPVPGWPMPHRGRW